MTAIPARTDVLVVGGGPAGSSTAWHLARLGYEVAIVDRARFPRDKPCAEYLSPEASRILDAMGALAPIERQSPARLRGMIVRAPDGRTMRGDFAGRHRWRGFADHGLAVPRRILDTLLLERARAAGALVIEGVRVGDVVRGTGGRVTGVRVEGGAAPDIITARMVVGADGIRSVVARRLGLARTAWWPRRVALVAHYHGVAGMTDAGEMHVDRDGYIGVASVGNDVTNVALVVPVRIARQWRGRITELLEGWIANDPRLAVRFAGAIRIDEVRATGPFAQRARRAWTSGAALVGDAADFFDPFTGEGIFAALRGGEMLAPFADEFLRAARAAAADRALAGYEAARRREFGGKWTVERLVALAVAWPPLLNRVIAALAARKELADLFVGVTGDFVPASQILRAGYLARLLLPARA